MSKYRSSYCKIFINTDEEKEVILNLIEKITMGSKKRWTIISDLMKIELINNEDFSEEKSVKAEDGFLYSKYYLGIEPGEGIKEEQYITGVIILLENLRSSGYKVVASCDFQNELSK